MNNYMKALHQRFFRKPNLTELEKEIETARQEVRDCLDKVQRQTGLDLRRFDDAVTFKILYELKKCGQEKPRQIY